MAEHAWTVICHLAILDQYSGQTSMIQSANKLVVNSVTPARLDRAIAEGKAGLIINVEFDLVSSWCRTDLEVPEQVKAKIVTVEHSGRAVSEAQFDVELQEFPATTIVRRIVDLPFSGPGRYWYSIEVQTDGTNEEPQWRQVAKLPLQVEFGPLVGFASEPEPPSLPPAPAEPSSDSQPAPAPSSPLQASPKRQRRGSSPRPGRK